MTPRAHPRLMEQRDPPRKVYVAASAGRPPTEDEALARAEVLWNALHGPEGGVADHSGRLLSQPRARG